MKKPKEKTPEADNPLRAIEKTTSGRYRCTLRRNGKRLSVLSFATLREAQQERKALESLMASDHVMPGESTVKQWARIWLNETQLNNPDYATIESRVRLHIETSAFAGRAVRGITVQEVRDWAKALEAKQTQHRHGKRPPKPLSKSSRKNTITVLRAVFQYAVDDETNRCHCKVNPVIGVSIKTSKDDKVLKMVPEDVPLRPRETARIIELMASNPERHIVEVAYGTGLRQGEMWNLELRDVHLHEPDPVNPSIELNYVYVRWGSKGRPPKNGQHRKVPLFGIALEGMEDWLRALPSYAPANPEGLVFPTRQVVTRNGKIKSRGGYRRAKTKVPRAWVALQKAEVLGPGRRFYWHALRHTCATALLCGWWGHRWQLIEVSKILGHSSVEVTTMYSHLLDSALNEIAARTQVAFDERQGRPSVAVPTPPAAPPAPAAARAATPYQPRGAARTGRRVAVGGRRPGTSATPRESTPSSASDMEGPRRLLSSGMGPELISAGASKGRRGPARGPLGGPGGLQLVDQSKTNLTHPLQMTALSKSCPEWAKTPIKPTKASVYGTEGRTFESSRARESSQVLSPLSADEIGQSVDNGPQKGPKTPRSGDASEGGSQGKQENRAIHDQASKAQRLVQAVASGRQDAHRIAEDLAMALLMSKADKRHHEAARLVLKDTALRIPRALELAIKLMGPAPKVAAKKKRAR